MVKSVVTSGFVVRFRDGEIPLYLYRGPALLGTAEDYHMGDRLSSAAIFASAGVAGRIAMGAIAPEHHGKVEIIEAERATTLGEVVQGLPRP